MLTLLLNPPVEFFIAILSKIDHLARHLPEPFQLAYDTFLERLAILGNTDPRGPLF